MNYYIIHGSDTVGPYTLGQLRSMWNSGIITGKTLFAEEGYANWHQMQVMIHKLEPASPPPPVPFAGGRVQTIEATSKEWKVWMLISGAVLVFGFFALFIEPFVGAFFLLLGMIGWLISRIGAWWNHG